MMNRLILLLVMFSMAIAQSTSWRRTAVWWRKTGSHLVFRVDLVDKSYYFYAKPDSISGSGIPASAVSDSCDNVRDAIRDTVIDFWSDSIPQATIWSRISSKPSTYPPSTHGHFINDTIQASNIDWSKVINEPVSYPKADSTTKMDTTYAPFQTYINNHAGGGGVTAEQVSDSCDNVRSVIRDTIGIIDIEWDKIVNEPATYPPSAHSHLDAEVDNGITLTNITQITTKPITSLTSGNYKVYYSNGASAILELTLGAANTYLMSNGATSVPSWGTPAGGSGGPATVKLTADQAFTVVARANVTGLSFSVTSGIYYHFRFVIIYRTAATTTGAKFGITSPAYTTRSCEVRIGGFATDGAGGEWQGAITATDSVMSTAVQAITTDYVAIIEGTILPSATGTLQVQAATEVASSAMTIRQGTIGFLYTAQ